MQDVELLRSSLAAHGQAHLLEYHPSLSPTEKSGLLAQISGLELATLSRAFAQSQQQSANTAPDLISPAPTVTQEELASESYSWKCLGYQAIAAGQVAAVCLAGGQGTRLGFDGPKGAYDAGFPSGKSLFQLHAERILRLQVLSGGSGQIPLYVMTSPLNDSETRAFYEQHGYFGLHPSQVTFFSQGTLPCFDFAGKILLESPAQVACAPDGNGGVYGALARSGALADMENRGVSCVHMFAVDNPLACPGDALFVGCCLAKRVEAGNMCVPKLNWDERVGVAALRNGQFHVVEYSEISEDMARKRDAQGKLLFGSANICSHFFKLDFLVHTVVPGMQLTHHVARKAIPTVADLQPKQPNGIKLELFIFDAFPMARTFVALEVPRRGVFAPIKNASGPDSPATARQAVSEIAREWLGGCCVLEGEGDLEVSPLLSLEGEGLEALPGHTLKLPCEVMTRELMPVPVLGRDTRKLVLNIKQVRPGVHQYQVVSVTQENIEGEENGHDKLRARLAKINIAQTTPVQALFILQELIELSQL